MAIAKVLLNNTAQMDTTQVTVTASDLASGKTALGKDGVLITGTASSGYTANDWLDPTKPTGAVVSNYAFSNNDYSRMLARRTGITSVSLPEATFLPAGFCANCTGLEEFHGPKIETMNGETLRETKITAIVLPSWTTNGSSEFYGCSLLTMVDRGGAGTISGTYTFRWCSTLSTLVLRSTTMVELGGINAFMSTPFASGGTGGTLWVPASLISSYQAATNWSTILGYTNNQIKSIESSATDPDAPADLTTHYVDGSLIPT